MTFYVRRDPVANPTYGGVRADPDGAMRDKSSVSGLMRSREEMRDEIDWLSRCKRVLDLGCGNGAALSCLSEHSVGVDPDAESREMARRWNCPVLPSVHDLPPVQSFDGMISYHVVEHMFDPEADLTAAFSRLMPNARFVIGTPDFSSPCAIKYGARYRHLHDATHINLFGTESLVRFIRHCAGKRGADIDRIVYPFHDHHRAQAAEWRDLGHNYSPPARGNIVSVYGYVGSV